MKIKQPDPIIIEAPDLNGELKEFRADVVTNAMVDKVIKQLTEAKAPAKAVCDGLSLIFGGESKYYFENYDIRVLNQVLDAFKEEYQNPGEAQST